MRKSNKYFESWDTRGTVKDFFNYDIEPFEKALRTDSEKVWKRRGEQRALQIFHDAAVRVPAYKDFLRKKGVIHTSIKTINDFTFVPITSKENYISVYPYKQRLWDGDTRDVNLVAVSSGTTGNPTAWPRGGYQEFDASITHELLYKYIFNIHTKKTAVIVGFPMGMYVSGIATTLPSWLISEKGYDMTVLSVGNNKTEVLKVIQSIVKDFEQIILLGHPFFVKDVIETGKEDGVNWAGIDIRFALASEGFSESWREYVMGHIKKKSALDAAISLYGTSEMLLVGFETPVSILFRKKCEDSLELSKKFFTETKSPNVFQYNPLMRHVESVDNSLVCTVQGSAPLIRYDTHDNGGIISLCAVKQEMKDGEIKDGLVWNLPMLYLTGRGDHAVIFYGANIYTQYIRDAIDMSHFHGQVTGKFVVQKRYDKEKNQHLDVHIEIMKDIKKTNHGSLVIELQKVIYARLLSVSSEYVDVVKHCPVDAKPHIIVHSYNDNEYFPLGVKPKCIYSPIYE